MTLVDLARHFEVSRWKMARDLDKAGKKIGEDLVRHAKAKIGEYQPATGPFSAWDPLTAGTLEEKALAGYPTPYPLLREGDMRDSITYQVQRKAASVVVILEATDPKAATHEYGSPGGLVPARPFLHPTVYERMKFYTEEIHNQVVVTVTP